MRMRAVRTRLRRGMEESYARLHSSVPAALAAQLERCGDVEWLIFRSGRDLFHIVLSDDSVAVDGVTHAEGLEAWHDAVRNHLAPLADDGIEMSAPLSLVWSLSTNSPEPPQRLPASLAD